MAESIADRILRLRNSKGWSRPELARQMAKAAGLPADQAFTGEAVRRWEENISKPSRDTRAALAKLFDKSESYIEFGSQPQQAGTVREPATAPYGVSEEALEIARAFDQLHPQAQEFIRRGFALGKGGVRTRRSMQHDVRVRESAPTHQASGQKKSAR